MDVGACDAETGLPFCRTEATRGLLTPQSRRKRTPEDAHHLDSIPETTEKPPRMALADDPSTVRQPNFGTQLKTRCDAQAQLMFSDLWAENPGHRTCLCLGRYTI